jgi:RNase P/RNase MRP subunit POP5
MAMGPTSTARRALEIMEAYDQKGVLVNGCTMQTTGTVTRMAQAATNQVEMVF